MGPGVALVAAVATAVAQPDQRTTELLAPPGAQNTVATFRNDGATDRVYVTAPIRAASPTPAASYAQRYGAMGQEGRTVPVRVGHLRLNLNPFKPILAEGLASRERMRVQWLDRTGLINAVRTFRNGPPPAAPRRAEAPADLPEPILRFRVPDGVRTEPNRYRVRLPDGLERADRVFVPGSVTPLTAVTRAPSSAPQG